MEERGVPTVMQQDSAVSLQCQDAGSILNSASGLRIWHCRSYGCRLQLQLQSDPWPGNSMCCGAATKEKKQKKRKENGGKNVPIYL